MSENITPQDSDKIITTKNPEELLVERNIIRFISHYLVHMVIHFFMFFNQPIKYFKDMKPRKSVILEFISTIFNMLIPLFLLLVGSLAVVWRVYSSEMKDTPFTIAWGNNLIYILTAIIIISSPSLIYNLKKNFRNKKYSRFQMFLFSIRQWFIQFIPLAIGFTFTFLAFIIEDTWRIERIAVYYMVVLHMFLIWQVIIFSSLIYAQSDNKRFSIKFGVILFISIIIGEQILAIALNDVIWEDWTIPTIWREWIQWGLFA